jgi:hypothetical protein
MGWLQIIGFSHLLTLSFGMIYWSNSIFLSCAHSFSHHLTQHSTGTEKATKLAGQLTQANYVAALNDRSARENLRPQISH